MWRRERQLTQLKWLIPGMGVKRWLPLALAGLALVTLGMAVLADVLDINHWQHDLPAGQSPAAGPLAGMGALLVLGSAIVAIALVGLSRSLLSAYRRGNPDDVVDVVYRHRWRQRGPKVVAIGGGHGLNSLLRALKEHTDNITAIVTVADDGGSSGKLRRDLGVLPPGDFRNCLAALSDAEGLMTQLFQYGFGDDSELEGHSFGNLYITAMASITGSFESALAESGRVLAVRGRVIPSTLAQVTLCADIAAAESQEGTGDADQSQPTRTVRGESNIPMADGAIERVYLDPEDAPAFPEAIQAILEADLIVAGPGSLYTSVMPNLLVRDLASAVRSSTATKVYVCNVATQPGETLGYDVSDHVTAMRRHLGTDLFAAVLANHTFAEHQTPGGGADWVHLPPPNKVDYQLVTRDLADSRYPWRHDSAKLAQSLLEFISG